MHNRPMPSAPRQDIMGDTNTPMPLPGAQDDEHHEDHAEHPSRKGGYVYALPEEVAAVKAQRAAIWEWLRVRGGGGSDPAPLARGASGRAGHLACRAAGGV